MKIFPCSTILSAKAQEKVFKSYSVSENVILLDKNSTAFSYFSSWVIKVCLFAGAGLGACSAGSITETF